MGSAAHKFSMEIFNFVLHEVVSCLHYGLVAYVARRTRWFTSSFLAACSRVYCWRIRQATDNLTRCSALFPRLESR